MAGKSSNGEKGEVGQQAVRAVAVALSNMVTVSKAVLQTSAGLQGTVDVLTTED